MEGQKCFPGGISKGTKSPPSPTNGTRVLGLNTCSTAIVGLKVLPRGLYAETVFRTSQNSENWWASEQRAPRADQFPVPAKALPGIWVAGNILFRSPCLPAMVIVILKAPYLLFPGREKPWGWTLPKSLCRDAVLARSHVAETGFQEQELKLLLAQR